VISAALAAFLALQTAIEPSKAADTRPTAASRPQYQLTPAVLERLEKLSKMSTDQRAQVLGDLPPAQRDRIEKGLERLDALTPGQRDAWFNRYRVFNQLPPQQKETVRDVVKEFEALPEPRQDAVRAELEAYKSMPMWARVERMRSADFRSKFNPEERDILQHSAVLLREPLSKTAKP
jgi:hypothetical protein